MVSFVRIVGSTQSGEVRGFGRSAGSLFGWYRLKFRGKKSSHMNIPVMYLVSRAVIIYTSTPEQQIKLPSRLQIPRQK